MANSDSNPQSTLNPDVVPPPSAKVRRRKGPARRSNGPAQENDLRLVELLNALKAARDGDFSVRMSTGKNGIIGQIARAFINTLS